MNASERACKIVREFCTEESESRRRHLAEIIIPEITEAEQESRNAGFEEAKEKAARIVHICVGECKIYSHRHANSSATDIRSLSPSTAAWLEEREHAILEKGRESVFHHLECKECHCEADCPIQRRVEEHDRQVRLEEAKWWSDDAHQSLQEMHAATHRPDKCGYCQRITELSVPICGDCQECDKAVKESALPEKEN